VIDEGMAVHVNMEVIAPVLTGIIQVYIVTCDRLGYECSCKHGGYYTCADRYNPGMYSYLLQMKVY
jgi:hypothetical protein